MLGDFYRQASISCTQFEDSGASPSIFIHTHALRNPNMASNPKVPIPLPTDDTFTVRAYIVRVLVTCHDFSVESAHHSAAEWKIGTGADFRKMKASRYRETFGNRVARILYREVRVQALEEQHAKSKPLSRETRGTYDSLPNEIKPWKTWS